MATLNGVVGTQTISFKTVTDGAHPAVVRLVEYLSGNGIIAAGEVLAYDADGKAVSYDPAASDTKNVPVGVCTEDVDTSKDTAGGMCVHGILIKKALTVKGESISQAQIKSLEAAIPVWVG